MPQKAKANCHKKQKLFSTLRVICHIIETAMGWSPTLFCILEMVAMRLSSVSLAAVKLRMEHPIL